MTYSPIDPPAARATDFLDVTDWHAEPPVVDEPPRRVSVAIYVLGALFLVTALVVLWHPWAR